MVADGEGDTIFAIDRISEDIVIERFDREMASIVPIVLIAEGIAGGKIVLPEGASETDAVWRIIVDPIDGTRGLMYQKAQRMGIDRRRAKSRRKYYSSRYQICDPNRDTTREATSFRCPLGL